MELLAEAPLEGGVTTLHDAIWTWTRSQPGEIAENYPLPAEECGPHPYLLLSTAGR